MINHYFKSTFRNLFRFKLFSVLNILGLSISMTLAMLIFLFVHNELSTDKHIPDVNRIYRGAFRWFNLNASTVDTYEFSIPEIELVSVVNALDRNDGNLFVKNDSEKIFPDFIEVDTNFLKMFQIPLLYGNPKIALKAKNSAVISAQMAKKLFGNKSPLGKEIVLEKSHSTEKRRKTISGVFKDLPTTASMKFQMILNSDIVRSRKDDSSWSFGHFIKLKEGADFDKVNQLWIDKVLKHNFKESEVEMPDIRGLFSYRELYFNPDYGEGLRRHGNLQLVYVYLAIGILVLLISSFNFINLSTSIASKRAKEIGVKKFLGCSKWNLFKGLMFECVLICIISFSLSLILLEVLYPYISSVLNMELNFKLYSEQREMLLFFFLGSLLLALFAGIYPALILTSFSPVKTIKGQIVKGNSGLFLRRTLIVFQFVISALLIIGTILIVSQSNYIQNIPLGYKKNQITYIKAVEPMWRMNDHNVITSELQRSPYIENASFCRAVPGVIDMQWGRTYKDKDYYFYAMPVDPNYLELMDVEIIKGRGFTANDKRNPEPVLIINEQALNMFGKIDSVLGQKLGNMKVVGVCKDFYIHNPSKGYEPFVLYCAKGGWNVNHLMIRFAKGHTKDGITFIKSYWRDNYPDYVCNMHFLNKSFDKQYIKEQKLSGVMRFFVAIAVFIACLGLFGLSVFMAEQRNKEFGVRKVLGAYKWEIIHLQLKEFFRLLIIANIIAWPIAYYVGNNWLSQFQNHITFSWYFYILGFLLTTLITVITVAYMGMKAARVNPIEVLKYE
ncbi:MAG: ABC transporter permease [Bacteroidales bacterium]